MSSSFDFKLFGPGWLMVVMSSEANWTLFQRPKSRVLGKLYPVFSENPVFRATEDRACKILPSTVWLRGAMVRLLVLVIALSLNNGCFARAIDF